MNCPYKDCVKHIDCGILNIIGKIPKSMEACSYSRNEKQFQKDEAKRKKPVNIPKKKNK